jgi:hypothetical protein
MHRRIPFKFLGRIPEDDPLHQVLSFGALDLGPAPQCVNVPGVGCVPQYAPTVYGDHDGFDPATDCGGYFTLLKFQVHNNCYNYALDIASNSMAQPGRMHGMVRHGDFDGDRVINDALLDGLKLLGERSVRLSDVLRQAADLDDGSLVALLMAPPDHSVDFPGDFHWVRCDDLESSSWSQKPGTDQVSNLDFAGKPIADPSCATWSLNAGPFNPTKPGGPDFLTAYEFRAWMFVPDSGVHII